MEINMMENSHMKRLFNQQKKKKRENYFGIPLQINKHKT